MGSFKEAVVLTAFSAVLAAGLSACDRQTPPTLPAPESTANDEDGYVASPSVTAARLDGDKVLLEGRAEKGAQVRLATPDGQEQLADADDDGRWRIITDAAPEPRILGLSMSAKGRRIQAQGYVLLGPEAKVTLLRAGAGAVRLAAGGKPRITTFDYDRAGGAVVSGLAPPDTALQVRGDSGSLGEGRSDKEGRFSIPISRPLSPGQHRLQISGKGVNVAAVVEVSPAEPLVASPFRSRRTPFGLRADWMTPGGGAQTTLILN